MRDQRYTRIAIGLHGLIALAILFQISLGWRMDGHGAETYLVFQLHKSVGITILLLSLARLGWRLLHRPPPLPAHLSVWERRLASFTHIGFYVVMIGLPITGWVIVSASKTQIPTLLYGAIPWPHLPGLAHASVPVKTAWRLAGETGHEALAKLTYALFALHVAGALKHQLIDRDDTLSRMIPGMRRGPWFGLRALAPVIVIIGAFLAGREIFRSPPAAPAVQTPTKTATVASVPAAPPPAPPSATGVRTGTPPVPSKWELDPGGQLMFATRWSGQPVTGTFRRWTARIAFAPEALDASSVEVTIDPASVDSGDVQRDATLPTEDWLNAAVFPKAVFKADHFRKRTKGYVAGGILTLKGHSHPVRLEFDVQIDGRRAKASGHAVVDRTIFGVGQGEYGAVDQIPANVDVRFDLTAHKTSGS